MHVTWPERQERSASSCFFPFSVVCPAPSPFVDSIHKHMYNHTLPFPHIHSISSTPHPSPLPLFLQLSASLLLPRPYDHLLLLSAPDPPLLDESTGPQITQYEYVFVVPVFSFIPTSPSSRLRPPGSIYHQRPKRLEPHLVHCATVQDLSSPISLVHASARRTIYCLLLLPLHRHRISIPPAYPDPALSLISEHLAHHGYIW